MDFATLFATTPLGTIVAFSDGTPQPPKHHKKKLSAWESRNGKGRLIGRRPDDGKPHSRDYITLETGVFGDNETIIMRVRKIFGPDSQATFEEVERQPEGSFAIITDSIHVGRELHAVRATREAIEAEKERGFRPDHYRIVQFGALGTINEAEVYA